VQLIKTFMAAAALFSSTAVSAEEPVSLVIDADTANEMDDLYAISQALLDPRLKVTGIVAAHFNNYDLVAKKRWHDYDMRNFVPVVASHDENNRLLAAAGVQLPTFLGGDQIIGHSWGYHAGTPVPSAPGIDFIIAQARSATPDKPLKVVVLGPLTNVAAALISAPDIARNIHIYALGMHYDPKRKVWNKNEFNARNDLNAVDYILDRDDVAITVLPASVASALTFKKALTRTRLKAADTALAKLLDARWDFVHAGDTWIMWDLALTLAIANPAFVKTEQRSPPPENKRKVVEVITHIDAAPMEAYFWNLLEAHTGRR
jgi:inosine-uridine nucleoside N-ribohydrolase